MPHHVRMAKHPSGAQSQVVGVGAGQGEAVISGAGRGIALHQPSLNIVCRFISKWVEPPALTKRRVQRPPPVRCAGKAGPHRVACRSQATGQYAEILGEESLQPLPKRLGQTRRRAAGGDGNQHRVAINDRGPCEVAQIGPVHDINQQAVRAHPRRRSLGLLTLQRDDRHRRAVRLGLIDQNRARTPP